MTLQNAAVRATVAVADITAAAAFYENILGLSPEPSEGMDQVRIYPCGAGTTVQVYLSEHAGTAKATVASWTATDFDAAVDELAANGVAFERYDDLPSDERGVHAFGDHRVAWFKDPDGNTLALDNGQSPG